MEIRHHGLGQRPDVPDSPGLNDTVRAQSKSLSAHGYLVVAVDLYDGRTPSSSKEAEEWMNALPLQDTVSKLQGAMGFLQNWMSDPTKVGVVGWGSGGTLALRLAAAENNLKAVVVNYGPLSQEEAILGRITAPVLINVGAIDPMTSLDQIASLTSALKIPRSKKDVKIYADAGHDFEDTQNRRDYNLADAIDADNRTVIFLAKWLKGH
jgi:carboxymethylenebutenolidase